MSHINYNLYTVKVYAVNFSLKKYIILCYDILLVYNFTVIINIIKYVLFYNLFYYIIRFYWNSVKYKWLCLLLDILYIYETYQVVHFYLYYFYFFKLIRIIELRTKKLNYHHQSY